MHGLRYQGAAGSGVSPAAWGSPSAVHLSSCCCISGSPHLLSFFPLVLATWPLKIVILKKAPRQARNNPWLKEPLNKYGNIDEERRSSVSVSCFIL